MFSFILEKKTYCLRCMWAETSLFEPTMVLYITPVNNASMQELVLQEHKQKLLNSCPCYKRDPWHFESRHMLQPPTYLIIVVNRFTYIDNKIIKNRSLIPLDLNVLLGLYKFNLRATVDHHGHSINFGQYTSSVNCCEKPFLVTILELLNAILMINIAHLLHIYYCTN